VTAESLPLLGSKDFQSHLCSCHIREGGREGGGVLMANDVGVFMCGALVTSVNQVRSSREVSV
jgi:hypothetical protein